jgi:hypothetical protein
MKYIGAMTILLRFIVLVISFDLEDVLSTSHGLILSYSTSKIYKKSVFSEIYCVLFFVNLRISFMAYPVFVYP